MATWAMQDPHEVDRTLTWTDGKLKGFVLAKGRVTLEFEHADRLGFEAWTDSARPFAAHPPQAGVAPGDDPWLSLILARGALPTWSVIGWSDMPESDEPVGLVI